MLNFLSGDCCCLARSLHVSVLPNGRLPAQILPDEHFTNFEASKNPEIGKIFSFKKRRPTDLVV